MPPVVNITAIRSVCESVSLCVLARFIRIESKRVDTLCQHAPK